MQNNKIIQLKNQNNYKEFQTELLQRETKYLDFLRLIVLSLDSHPLIFFILNKPRKDFNNKIHSKSFEINCSNWILKIIFILKSKCRI